MHGRAGCTGMTFQEQIGRALKASGMSRFELSRRSGVAYSVIHRLLAGQNDVTLRTAERLCRVLGLGLTPIRKSGNRPKE